MRTQFKMLTSIALSLIFTQSYAVHVHIHAPSKHISAVGFTTNGTHYGSIGKTYHSDDLPQGIFTFDIGLKSPNSNLSCATSNGEKFIKLTSDTIVILAYDDNRCTIKMGPG